MDVRRILILGGYGNFGKRIAESLALLEGITVVIAGRDAGKARQLCRDLSAKGTRALLEEAVVDINDEHFIDELGTLSPDLVIHTGGPFQGQDYRVAEACIAVGCHYIDLADDRRFVCDIVALNERAMQRNLLVVSGASSVPGLSSTVIDSLMDRFSRLDEIDFAIAPGNRAERGDATVRGILSYTGHPFMTFRKGEWVEQYGWMSPRRFHFGDVVGRRWLANVDIPDLELFPERYRPVNTVRFQAGLELPLLHFTMVFMALLAKMGLIRDWSVFTTPIFNCGEFFKGLGTDIGGMQINLSGLGKDHEPQRIRWTLCAEHNVGPYIPTLSAIILAKKLIAGTLDATGARPCLGMYTLEEFDVEASPLGIHHQTEREIG